MSIKKVVLFLCALLILSTTVAYACTPADCSPGYWKNHTEIWYGDFEPAVAAQMLAGLQGGYDTRESRFEIAAQLNTEYWDVAACDD